jgi:hypothetical protein
MTILLLVGHDSSGQKNDLSKLSKWEITRNKIKIINVFKIYCDTTGQPYDTILISKSFYDHNGLLTEIQQDFSKDLKRYAWEKYFYNTDGYLIDTKSSVMVWDGVYVKESSYYLCEKYDNGNVIETIKYYADNPDKTIEKKIYEYNESGLLLLTKHYYNDKLNDIVFIEYTIDK